MDVKSFSWVGTSYTDPSVYPLGWYTMFTVPTSKIWRIKQIDAYMVKAGISASANKIDRLAIVNPLSANEYDQFFILYDAGDVEIINYTPTTDVIIPTGWNVKVNVSVSGGVPEGETDTLKGTIQVEEYDYQTESERWKPQWFTNFWELGIRRPSEI